MSEKYFDSPTSAEDNALLISQLEYGFSASKSDKRKSTFRSKKLWFQAVLVTLILLFLSNKTLSLCQDYPQLMENPTSESIEDIVSVPKDVISGKKLPLTLKELRTGKFSADIKEIQWIHSSVESGGTYLTKKNGKYIINKIDNSTYEKVLYHTNEFDYYGVKYQINDLVASPDLQYALVATNKSSIWRHSSINLFWVLNVETKQIQPLANGKIYFSKWAPDSNQLAYVNEDKNIFIKTISTGETKQITFDGDENIFNGKPDWVYEEEVFGDEFALWWSPNSEYLTFLKFNDTLVKNFPINFFVKDEFIEDSYPIREEMKYPKAGYENPFLGVNVYNVATNLTEELFNNYEDEEFNDYLVTEVLWVGTDKLFLRTTNRISNILKIVIVDAIDSSFAIARHETVDDGWFELAYETSYVPKDAENDRVDAGYVDTISVDGFNHLAYFSPIDASEPKVILTSGNYEIDGGVNAIDFETNKVYFISTKLKSVDRHLYSVDLLTGENLIPLVDDTVSGYYSASFSSNAKNILITYLGPNIPYQKIVDLNENVNLFGIFTANGKNITTNEKLGKILSVYDIPTTTLGEINLGKDLKNYGDEDIIANIREIKPANFDPFKKYPLFVYVYQGPISQLIDSRFSVSTLQVISSQLDCVVVTVDGRGTGFKGKKFRSVVYKNLSHFETIDQINAAKTYIKNNSFIDPERTLIYGHSYGGYMTLKTLENDDEKVFKYGISGAPVTDWKLYDSIYTERYMSTPEFNSKNYGVGAVGGSNNYTNFQRTKRFLILHGTGDDNVHIQNLYRLLDKFNLNNLENNYDLMVFPDSNHGIYYHNGGYIMYNKIIWWAKMAFNGQFDSFDKFDYHNGNLAKGFIINSFNDFDDSKYLRA